MTRAPAQLALFHTPRCIPWWEMPELGTYCRDCAADVVEVGEYYAVHDHVWPVEPDGGVLCIGCLEARIGRRLSARDFKDLPINRSGSGTSARLRDRLAREEVAP